jgi:hypothetical protein
MIVWLLAEPGDGMLSSPMPINRFTQIFCVHQISRKTAWIGEFYIWLRIGVGTWHVVKEIVKIMPTIELDFHTSCNVIWVSQLVSPRLQ